MCVCMCVCVCVRVCERVGGGGEREIICVCEVLSFAGISTSVKNMSLKRRVLKDAHHLCLF